MMMFSAAAAAFRARGTHVEQFGLPRDSKKNAQRDVSIVVEKTIVTR
jgi:hypothetical protein